MRILLDPETPTEGTPRAETPATPDLNKSAEALVAKHGDSTAALLVLLGENYKLRDKAREVTAKLPADGHAVITPDEVKLFARYKALGEPKDLETAKAERDTFKTEAEGFRREKLHGEAAALAGFKPAVLDRLAIQDKLSLVIVDGKDKAGKPVKAPHVKGEGDATTPLAKYAEAHWADFLPALKGEAKAPARDGSPARDGAPPKPETRQEGGPRRSLVR